MGTKTTNSIEATLYLADLPDTDAKGALLLRLLQTLRIETAQNDGNLRIMRHIPCTYIEYANTGLHGSILARAAQCPADLIEAQTARLGSGDIAHTLRAALAEHRCYLHFSATGKNAEAAIKRVVSSTLGILSGATPLALYWSPTGAMMDIDAAAQFLHPERRTSRSSALATGAATSRLFQAVHVADRRFGAKAVDRVVPHRVTARYVSTPRPAPTLGKRLARLTTRLQGHLPGLPFGLNYGASWRVAAGMMFGIAVSGWVSATVSADPAMATPTKETAPLEITSQP